MIDGRPGPGPLGRSVVVADGAEAPTGWAGADRVVVDDAAVAAPAATVGRLHSAWANREPIVIDLRVPADRFRPPVSVDGVPWDLGVDLDLGLDRLHFLVWANSWDARDGTPVWWWGVKAARLAEGARATPDGPADVTLADGTSRWVDGGPREPIDPGAVGGHPVVHRESVERGRLRADAPPTAPTAEMADDQHRAVAHPRGPARVIAPAGSGKTRVLTERLRHLVADRGWDPATILAVAYNVRARDEMVARTEGLGARVQTLNGLAYSILARQRGTAPPVVDEREVRRIVDGLLPKRRVRANTDPLAPYLEALTEVRLGLRDPDAVEDERGDVPGFAAIVEPYREELDRRGVVDFDEQVVAATQALLRDGALRRAVQADHRHLLVDEFQDLTPAHLLLVRLVAGPPLDVFGVGDDDQVIYGHAGADPRFLIHFADWFPGGGEHALDVNHRSAAPIVEAAATLLSYNHRRVAKEIRPRPDADDSADRLTVETHAPEAGATALVDVVRGWLDDGCPPGDIAVLTRVHALLLAPHVALAEAGVPVRSTVGPELLDRTGSRAALAYLRLAVTPLAMEPADLAEVYRRPSRGLPQWITKWFRGPMGPADLGRIAGRIDDAKVADKVRDLASDLAILAEVARTGTTRTILEAIRDRVGLGEAMDGLDRSKGGEGSSQLDDLEALVQVAELHPDPAGFETWLRRALALGRASDAVTLSTVHRVKGQEWPRVVVVGVTAGLCPHRLAADEEEERRVLHVAITRGRDRVVVLGDESRPSPFLAELDGSAPRRPVRLASGTTPRRPGPVPSPGARTPADRTGAGGTRREGGRKAVGPPLDGEAAAREEALKAWRRRRSHDDGVPAYVVASDATLRAIAERAPADRAALARAPGIGPAKLEKYGAEILAVVASG